MTASAFRRTALVACAAFAATAGGTVAWLRRPPDRLPIETAWIARVFCDGEARGSASLVLDRRTAVTCDHVLTESDRVVLEYPDDVKIGATVVERGEADDVAILRLDSDAPAEPRRLSTSASVAGTTLFLCTRWGGATMPTSATTATPALACLQLPGMDEYAQYVMIDRRAEHGTSGSAWVDEQGALVGMQDAIFEFTGPPARSLSGAVPVAVIAARLDHSPVVRGSLRVGVLPTSLLLPDPKEKPHPPGLMVLSLRFPPTRLEDPPDKAAWSRESPLLKAEIIPGAVITAVDGAPVTNLDDWWARVTTRPPGTTVQLSYVFLSPAVRTARAVTIAPRKRAR